MKRRAEEDVRKREGKEIGGKGGRKEEEKRWIAGVYWEG